MDRRPEAKAGSSAVGRQIAMRFAAFSFLGMVVGVPGSVAVSGLIVLPGAAAYGLLFSTSFVVIGTTLVARILWAPFLDSFNPPLTGRLGRRRGWVALLLPVFTALAIGVGLLIPLSSVSVSPVYLGLLVAEMLVAGGLFAAVDGLRSAQPTRRTQGILAVGQYAGIIVPTIVLAMVTKGAGNIGSTQNELAVPIVLVMTGSLVAGWIGLWLLPGEDAKIDRVADLPRVRRLLASDVNLSAGGLRLTAWLYGVFICPVIDFFERHGPTAVLALLVLLLGNLVNQWGGAGNYAPYANTTLAADLQAAATAAIVLNPLGLVAGGAAVFWLSPLRGFAAALLIVLIFKLASTIAVLTAPALTPLIVAHLIQSFAAGAFYITLIAVIARLVSPRFASFQFSLLVIVALPRGVIQVFGGAAQTAIGLVGTHILFLVITTIAIGLTIALARRLEPDLRPAD